MVKVYPTFEVSKSIGKHELQMDVKNIKDLIEQSSQKYGNDFSTMAKKTAILVNGRNINHLKGKRTTLKDGDTVHFVNPAAGG